MHIGARACRKEKRAMLQYRYGKAPLDGIPFGHRASVMHCLTWAEFQQALARGLLVMMWSVYVDDSNIPDPEHIIWGWSLTLPKQLAIAVLSFGQGKVCVTKPGE